MFLAPKRVLQLSAIPIPNSRMETRPSLLMNRTFQLRQASKLELKEDVSLISPKKRTLEHPLNLLWSVKLRYKSCYILFYFQISYLKSPNVCTWPVGQHYFSSLTQVPQVLPPANRTCISFLNIFHNLVKPLCQNRWFDYSRKSLISLFFHY